MNEGKELIAKLKRYDLDLDVFLDMIDQWNGLSSKIKVELLDEHEKHLKRMHDTVTNFFSND